MIIYLTRHGQTNLNKARLMQGLTDEPLNETGLAQARAMREKIGDVHFDAVYASPLNRAVMTGAIIGGVDPSEVITDPRIIEADFGVYEKKKYYLMGPAMTLYWTLPEIFPAPKSVETTASLRRGEELRDRPHRLPRRDHAGALGVPGGPEKRARLAAEAPQL